MKQETAQHTPGPWEILSSLNNHMICDSKKSVVAVAVNSNEEANARLIAAAPLLLERLQEVVEAMRDCPDFGAFVTLADGRSIQPLARARAAIAAAQQ